MAFSKCILMPRDLMLGEYHGQSTQNLRKQYSKNTKKNIVVCSVEIFLLKKSHPITIRPIIPMNSVIRIAIEFGWKRNLCI